MLPIALRPNGRRAVVVGGGGVATRKAEALADAGYSVVVVAAAIADERLHSLGSPHVVVERPYETSDLDAAAIAIAATDSDAVNARVVADARAAGVLVCDASDPSRGDFHMPAVVRRGELTISVDTAGTTPAFSKRVASEIAEAFGPEYGDAARTLARMRDFVKSALPSDRRAEAMRTLTALPVSELAAMHPNAARERAGSTVAQLAAGPPCSAMATAVCATRASALAMVQTRTVAARLAARGIASTLLPITTTGDRLIDRAIDRLGSVNVFVTELETALRDRRADYAVHSCKDLPSELAADLHIAAISTRDDPRDAFCSERYASFDALPAGAVVGTSSPRRRAQLAALRRDLVYEEMRGNVDTRLRKLRDGKYDAIVLAMAGLNRLHLRATHTVAFPVDVIVPAVGQGALAIETRRDDDFLIAEIEAAVNDAASALCVRCERSILRALRAGCSAPIGIYANVENGRLAVEAASAAGGTGAVRRLRLERACETVEEAEAFGIEIAAALQAGSARRVVLPRTVARPSRIAALLRASGIEVVELAAGDDGPDPAEGRIDMVLFPSSGAVAAATVFLERLNGRDPRPAVIAMGPASASAARAAGFEPDAVAPEASVEAFVALARERLGRRP
jgi:hydroxymethylbilane synthase